VFRRRRRDADEPDDELLDPEADADLDEPLDGPLDEAGQPVADDLAAEPGPTTGPWDVDDLPEGDEVARVDLGGLLVPVTADVELRVDMTPEGEVVSATLVSRGSAMQVNAFAAPRRQGIWAEVRQEIAASVSAGGGSTEEADGPFGVELRARVPSEVPGQGRVLQAARFLGVDGPRWFLRGLVSGPAATDPKQAAALENLFRQVVVVRGKDAMAPRDQLPMHLPREVTDAGLAEDAGGAIPDINRLERGPEIAETR
jgi:hypothetical protein